MSQEKSKRFILSAFGARKIINLLAGHAKENFTAAEEYGVLQVAMQARRKEGMKLAKVQKKVGESVDARES